MTSFHPYMPQEGWVIVGSLHNPSGRPMITASKEVTDSSLHVEAEFGRAAVFAISSQIRNPVMVVADTWREAFEALFRQWTPDAEPAPGRAIAPSAPALPPRPLELEP